MATHKRHFLLWQIRWRSPDGEAVVGSRWSVVSGQWSVVSGQWAVGSGQWAVGSGQWAMGSGRTIRARSRAWRAFPAHLPPFWVVAQKKICRPLPAAGLVIGTLIRISTFRISSFPSRVPHSLPSLGRRRRRDSPLRTADFGRAPPLALLPGAPGYGGFGYLGD